VDLVDDKGIDGQPGPAMLAGELDRGAVLGQLDTSRQPADDPAAGLSNEPQ
jgi:hypothetical protein